MRDDALTAPVQYVKGVGPVRAARLAALGIHTVEDLLTHLPFRYAHQPSSKPIGHLELAETATIVGSVERLLGGGYARRRSVTAYVVDGTGRCRVRWFNSPFLRDRLAVGQVLRLTGKVEADDRQAVFTNPIFEVVEGGDPLANDAESFEPVYPATAEVPSRLIARAVRSALERYADRLIETLPPAWRARRGLPPRRTAIERIHQPIGEEDAETARRRLAYDELLAFQIAIQLRRRAARVVGAPAIHTSSAIEERIRARLPFDLTAAQQRACARIALDLAGPAPMARLLQGDVGAGKTAVAVHAALIAVANRHQVAMLAPTEVLATQTFERIQQYLQGSRVRLLRLVGGQRGAGRRERLDAIARGEIDLVVGTHALLEQEIRFASLGLVVIDEQHRFGVAQRDRLRAKGGTPHYLVMTATPIPRTLTMTLYGDLDVSVLDELPPGRKPVATRMVTPREQADAWRFVRQWLAGGEQAFIVYPLVDASDAVELKDAESQFALLRETTLQGFRLGLLHGRMPADEKQRVLDAFRGKALDVLVATTVIEVGVDVPDATLMVVEHAERFGLSQLHQLRGRVGRGVQPATCLFMIEGGGLKARQRLQVLCSTTDGFAIAEADLALRGAGDLVGTRQHGLPAFRVADLVRDQALLVAARDDAMSLLDADADLALPAHAALRAHVLRRHPAALRDHLAG